jgi:S-adenosylmethionine decarboxylase proenzyme
MKGLHIIGDLYNCSREAGAAEYLVSADALRELCVNASRSAGLTVLGDHFYQFDGADATQAGGSTGAVVLAESHIAIHTWPERDGATLDVYVCNFTADNTARAEVLFKTIVDALKPADVLIERVWRGKDLPLKEKQAA